MQRWIAAMSLTLQMVGTLAQPSVGYAQPVSLVTSALVDHPLSLPMPDRSPYRWRRDTAAWGETLAEQDLRLRGYDEVYEIKTGGNQGIDRVAVKRAPGGEIVDALFVEVKAQRGSAVRLADTKHAGSQMSRKWMADRLRAMRRSPDAQVRTLAADIFHYSRKSGRPLKALGEVHWVNTKTGTYTRLAPDGFSVLSSGSVERYLQRVQQQATSRSARDWAARQLAQWDQIRSTAEAGWLTRNQSGLVTRILPSRGRLPLRAVTARARGALLRRVVARSAGPLAAVVAAAMDAKQMYDTESAFRSGLISKRDRNVAHITVGGGIVGAWAGAATGGAAGAWIGAFGGPFAPVTVPAGAFIGATIGGVGGYLGGSTVAGYAATEWYSRIDARLQDLVDRQVLATTPGFR